MSIETMMNYSYRFVVRLVELLTIAVLSGCLSQTINSDLSDPQPGIVFVSDRTENWDIYLMQPDGNGLIQLTDDPALDSDPDWSPDGRQIVFRSRRDGSSDLFIMGADGSNPQNLINDPADSLDDEFAPRWNPDGKTFSLYTDRYQPRGYCLSGYHQIALLHTKGKDQGIDLFKTIAGEQYSSSWSPDGRYLVFNSFCRVPGSQLYIYDSQTGDTNQLTTGVHSHNHPAWSHDGVYLAYTANLEGNADIYLLNMNSMEQTRLTDNPAKDNMPTWSPDGRRIAFVSNRDGNLEIYTMNFDGTNQTNISKHPADDWYPDWSPVADEH